MIRHHLARVDLEGDAAQRLALAKR